ncbi:hypothetical protein AQPE_2497 [Aquipluma nitroreducens]|uniref:Uncharacterized protein n=1 Tax=Aquipluma nitroreducens TaxID=2010828 RepID=A0A5K7SA05_9BACT|nr:hypothetical protein AQPE_2497 [Aquipluma nitroreducens]
MLNIDFISLGEFLLTEKSVEFQVFEAEWLETDKYPAISKINLQE